MTISAQTSEKAAFWSKHIADWQVSGLRQKEYCAQHGLHVKSFGRWKGVLKQRPPLTPTLHLAAHAKKRAPMIPLSIVPDIDVASMHDQEQSGSGVRLLVQNKYVIDLSSDFHVPTLQKLLTVLG